MDEISVRLLNFATARIESYLIFQPLADGGSKLGSRNTFQSIPKQSRAAFATHLQKDKEGILLELNLHLSSCWVVI